MSMVNQPPQLNLDELRRLKWLLGGAMALVSLWTVFFLDIEALTLVGAAGAVILATLLWPGLPGRVPGLVWKLAVPGIIVALVVDFYFSPDTLPVLIRTAILLVLYRAASYRRKREDLQLIVLGLFLIVVAGVLTVSLGFAFLLLLFTACALGFLFVINLIEVVEAGSNRTPEAELAWTRLGWRPLFARLRAVADWRLMAFAAGLFMAVVLISAALFVLIPRFEVGSGFFLDKYITRKSKTGFSEVVKFGSVSELIRDETVVMRVDLTDASSLRGAPYWRMVVLDEYTPSGFRVSAGLKRQLLDSQRVVPQLRGGEPGRNRETVGGTWTFYIEPGVSRYLPLPGSFGLVRLRDPVPVQSLGSHRLLALRSEPLTMTAMQLEDVELTSQLKDTRLPQQLADWQGSAGRKADPLHYNPTVLLQGPLGDANAAVLERIVAEITQGATLGAQEFATRAVAWIQQRHAYALAVQLPRGAATDDIVRWLDSNQPGFCEYFAAGFVVLARAAGYPARVIAGYHGGVLNGFQNYYMVRNADAHAWAEIHDGQGAWWRIDPTPGATATSAGNQAAVAAQKQDDSWSARTDSLRVLWYRRIVNFDSRNQVQMIDTVKTFTTDSGQALRTKLENFNKRVKAWLTQPWDRERLLGVAGGLAAGAVLLITGWRLVGWVRRSWRGWGQTDGLDPVRLEAGRELARLRDAETRWTEDGGRSAVARPMADSSGRVAAGEEDDDQSTEVARVREELRRLRYGHRATWPEPRGVFRRARRVGKGRR